MTGVLPGLCSLTIWVRAARNRFQLVPLHEALTNPRLDPGTEQDAVRHDHADIHVRWATTQDRTAALALEREVLDALADDDDLGNRAR